MDRFSHTFSPESGKAIVAKKDGYCFANYRGNSLTWTDWDAQDFGREKICWEDSSAIGFGQYCCSTRIGFARAFNSTSRREIENAVRSCAQGCSNPDECVVFAGHSEGGAIAAIAALEMTDLNPYVMTFGQPSTIDAPCPMLSGERLFRFVNTKVSLEDGITYDPVPFIQGLGADNFGYMIFLGEDSSRVASVGLGAGGAADFRPNVPFGLQAHSMVKSHAIPGYLDRLQSLHNSSAGFPIPANGFLDGSICNDGIECRSGQCLLNKDQKSNLTTCVPTECTFNGHCRRTDTCVDGVCVPKRQSCMVCDKDTDCASERCLSNLCAGESGLLDNNCNCKEDSDCATHRCRSGLCEAGLPAGARCLSPGDCSSGVCANVTDVRDVATTVQRCEVPGQGTGLAAAIDFEMSRSFQTRPRMSWGGLLVVMLCCMIITFTIVKRFLYFRRKDYTSIPSGVQDFV